MASLTKRRKRDGATVWDAQVRVTGYPPQSRSFPAKLEAQLWAAKTEEAVRSTGVAVNGKLTLADLIDEVEPRLRRRAAPLRYWRDELGHLRLAKIRPALIALHRDRLIGAPCGGWGYKKLKPRSPGTVWMYLQVLHRVFAIGQRELFLITENPVSAVKRPSLPRGPTRFLSDEEITALLDACKVSENTDLFAFVLLAITTGARKGELLALEWVNVDVERRWAILPKTKNGDARGLPLTQAVLDALMAVERAGMRVFPLDPARAFRTACKRAGITGCTLHTLRHSCASYLVRNGATLPEVGRLLGHRDLHSTQRYSHIADQHTAALVARVMGNVK
jgi:integrase